MYYNYVRIALVGALILLHHLFYHSGPYHIETSLLICRANQWTGVYMIGTSVMKELKASNFFILMFTQRIALVVMICNVIQAIVRLYDDVDELFFVFV